MWNWNLSVKFTIMFSWFLDHLLILSKYSSIIHNLAVCWKVIQHLLLCEEIPILTRFTTFRKVKSSTNLQRSSSRIQLALLFVPYDRPCGSRSRHDPRFGSFSMLFYFHWPGPTVICKNWDQTWTNSINYTWLYPKHVWLPRTGLSPVHKVAVNCLNQSPWVFVCFRL